ncbi:hypothetical protein [uncultured Treponema sp.]|uniref:hypothetical protein n=1 Tax=uncultured Treponema sp. TaxID=162155 RepID=UPI0015C06E32|nr:hypothetical protein [uncultured Treponema sp.]
MTGKIFKESSNIYEDEARILFDYYRKAAEKIVEEEIDIENKIEEAANNKNTSHERQRKHKIISIVTASIGGAALAGGVVAFVIFKMIIAAGILGGIFLGCGIASIVNLVKRNSAKKDFNNFENLIASYEEAKKNIRRNYKVSKLGVAYVPVATRVPFEGKSFVVDHTGTMPNTNFSLSVLHKPKELQESLENLEKNLNNIPVVEGNEDAEQIDTSSYSKSIQNITMHNYMGNIDREVRNISYLLKDSDSRSVSLPVIPPQSEEDTFLNEYATTETGGKPVIKVFNTEDFEAKLDTFTSISDLKKELEKNTNGGNTNYFKSLIRKLGDSVQIVSKIKTNSTSGLLDYTNQILAAVLKSGYNQYSAQLEAEELTRIRDTNFNYQDCVESYKPFELKESSKVKYDIYNQNWVAEDNTRTIMPFGINQIEEEVLMPLINNLMQETRVERLKIYNNIKDQKLSYLNKWHQDVEAAFRDNRKSGQDLITQITNAYAEYSTAHNTYLSYKQTQDAMKQTGRTDIETKEVNSSDEAIKEIEAKVESCREVGEAFQLYMRTLQNDINASSEKFGFVEYFEGSLRDGESKKAADSIVPENLQNLDPRRQKIIPVNSYFATYAELPPEPSVEPQLMEDFTMDLQQIASEQISRIDEETGKNSAAPDTEQYTENDNFEESSSETMENSDEEDKPEEGEE